VAVLKTSSNLLINALTLVPHYTPIMTECDTVLKLVSRVPPEDLEVFEPPGPGSVITFINFHQQAKKIGKPLISFVL
jgi:hypothetical protein